MVVLKLVLVVALSPLSLLLTMFIVEKTHNLAPNYTCVLLYISLPQVHWQAMTRKYLIRIIASRRWYHTLTNKPE